MAVKLEKSIKRELELDGRAYTITIAPEGVKVTEKGKRKGRARFRGARSSAGTRSWPKSSRCRWTRSGPDLRAEGRGLKAEGGRLALRFGLRPSTFRL